jgi:ABC-2 type transport system permease protein
MALLSGTFYVIDNLSPAFQAVSRVNPFFYVISGFRFGFLGQSDIGATNQAVLHGALGLGVMNAVLALVCLSPAQIGLEAEGLMRPEGQEKGAGCGALLFSLTRPSG